MLLTVSEISSDQPIDSWFCLRAQPKREHIAAACLRQISDVEEVEITQGPFQGLKALVTRLIAARERVEILIEWMGRTLRAEAGVADLEPLAGPGSAKTCFAVA